MHQVVIPQPEGQEFGRLLSSLRRPSSPERAMENGMFAKEKCDFAAIFHTDFRPAWHCIASQGGLSYDRSRPNRAPKILPPSDVAGAGPLFYPTTAFSPLPSPDFSQSPNRPPPPPTRSSGSNPHRNTLVRYPVCQRPDTALPSRDMALLNPPSAAGGPSIFGVPMKQASLITVRESPPLQRSFFR